MLQQTSATDYGQLRCLVCNDKASGLHYGVVSCESCKSFFGRKIKSKAKFSCEEGGNCVMDLYTRRHCPACRLSKCLIVGMKPERVWDDKRLETRKPLVRKARKKKEDPSQLPPLSPPSPPPPLPSTLSINPESTSSFEDLCLEMNTEQQTLMDTVCAGLQLSRKLYKELITQEKLQSLLKGIASYFATSLPGNNAESLMPPLQIPIKQEPLQFPPELNFPMMSAPPSSACALGNRTGAPPRFEPPKFDFFAGAFGAPPAVRPDSIVKIKQENMDDSSCACSGTNNIPLPFPTPAQQKNFLQPGEQCFDKTQLIVFNMALLGVVIRQTVQFAKCLPGFRDLMYEDQAVLIKAAILEVLMFRMAETYIPERNCVVDDITGTEWDFGIMMQSGFAASAEKTLRFTKCVHGFNLLRGEIALLEAAALLSPDRPELQHPKHIEEIQQKILMCLQSSVKVNHPNDKVLFAKLIVKLAEVRELVQSHIVDLNELKLPDHEKIFPLIAEIFNMDEGLMCNAVTP